MHFPQWAGAERGADPARGAILAHPDLVPRADAPRDSPSLADSSEEGSTAPETGHPVAPACLVPGQDVEVLGDLPQEGVYTITSARTLSTRHAYALKLNLFVECDLLTEKTPGSARSESYCPFCSDGWSEGCLPPSLNAYVAMIAANHDPVDGKLVGKHDWVIRFLRKKQKKNRPALVCYGGRQKGNAISKQRMAHWIVDAITLAYQAQGVPCPFRLRAHSIRSVASSWVLAHGASLTDNCRAAGWATPNTFARFYSLRVEPVSSCVFTSNG